MARITIEDFENKLEQAELIIVDDSPYLHSWNINTGDLISTNWEENDCLYEVDIDKDDIESIEYSNNKYIIKTEDEKYSISLIKITYI